jgi:hypothetical protein
MNCKICDSPSEKLFTKRILGKYNSGYYRCIECQFIQTDPPHWLTEAYSSAITALDIGLVDRNISFSAEAAALIDRCFPATKRYVDYAGGYGLFVRLMRDKGFDFYRQDMHCENLFAKHFDVTDLGPSIRFDLVTAFEVFEHFADPLSEIRKIFEYADSVVFSTQLVPNDPTGLTDWWYLAPETGQHIAFYSQLTLEKIASMTGRHYSHNGMNFHLFTREEIPQERLLPEPSQSPLRRWFSRSKERMPRISLLQTDYEFIKAYLHKQQGGL